jgi:WD40 repeat protein
VGLAGSVVLWDLTSRTKVADLPENNDVGQVVFSPDGSLLAVDNDQGEVEIWDATKLSLKTGPRLALKHNGKILNLAFSPDQKYLAGGGSENYVYLWDLMTGNEIARIPHTDDVNSVAFTNDGKWLLTASIKVIQIWSVKDIPIISVQNFSKEVCSKVTSNMSTIYWRQVYNNENYREICPGLPVSQN